MRALVLAALLVVGGSLRGSVTFLASDTPWRDAVYLGSRVGVKVEIVDRAKGVANAAFDDGFTE